MFTGGNLGQGEIRKILADFAFQIFGRVKREELMGGALWLVMLLPVGEQIYWIGQSNLTVFSLNPAVILDQFLNAADLRLTNSRYIG